MSDNHTGSTRLTWLLAVLVDTMRVAWVWPWLLALGAWMAPSYGQPLLPLWSLFALLIGARAAAQLATARASSTRQARLWMAVLGPLVVLALLWLQYGRPLAPWDLRWLQNATGTPELWAQEMAPAALAFFAAAGLWLRGVMDAGRLTDHEAIVGSFVTGSVAFVVLLLGSQLAGAAPADGTQAWMVAFAAAGMAALALASVERSLYAGGAGATVRLRLNRYWLGSVAIVIAAVLLLGLTLAALVAPETVAQAMGLLSPLVDLLVQAFLAVLYVVVYVLFLLLSPLFDWLRGLLANLQLPEALEELAAYQPASPLPIEQATGTAADLAEPFRWGLIIVVLVGAALLFALSLRFLKMVEAADADETRESILSRSLLNEQLRALWARLRGQAGAGGAADFLSLDGETPARREVRARYQGFLAAMTARNHVRPPGATPDAYSTQVVELTAKQSDALRVLTSTYVAVRYGDAVPEAQWLSEADVDWREDAARAPDDA